MKTRTTGWAASCKGLAAFAAAVLAGCSSAAEPPEGLAEASPAGPAGNASEADDGPCVALGVDRPSPRTILEVVDRVNELPQPATLPCFIESLARPLELYTTQSLLSAQPAVGRRSPRAFIFVDPLIMSIAFDGIGSPLLELGEVRPGGLRSVKAEIAFPVTGELPQAAPFERIHFTDAVTTCGLCHSDEEPFPDVTFARAFESRSLRPVPSERVSLASLIQERAICDGAQEPERCALLDAVFADGSVIDREFAETMATFY